MKHHASDHPNNTQKPWFKQFWPWVLIALPGTVVIASIITAVIAFNGADTLVADDYYKEGLTINKTFDDLKLAKTLAIKAQLNLNPDHISLQIQSNNMLNNKELLLRFKHPLDNNLDTVLHLQQQADGSYQAPAITLIPGKWYISLQSLNTDSPWRVDSTFFMPTKSISLEAQ
jgi:hypothetical protein